VWAAVSAGLSLAVPACLMGRNRRLFFAVEYALENTTLEVIVYQGQLDLICDIVGTLCYIHKGLIHEWNERSWTT